jgi:acyl-CoA synthetase (NDP forming)
LKSGNSEAGLKAAASHTGKMASSYAVYSDLLREAGAIQVETLTDLIAAGEVLASTPFPATRGPGAGVSVFSVPGGTRALTADQFDLHGVPLATFDRRTVEALTTALPEFGGVENPTDLTGQVLSHPGLFDQCLTIIADDPGTEALLVQVANRGPRDVMERVDLLGDVAARTGVPVVASFLGDSLPAAQRVQLRDAGVVCARDPAEAARFLGWLYQAGRFAARGKDPAGDHLGGLTTIERVPGGGPAPLPSGWRDIAAWLQGAGIAVPASRTLVAADDVAALCAELTYPLAVKATPDDADHKTESGLLALGVADAGEVARQAARIRNTLGRPQAAVLVQEMVAGGVEVVLAAVRNPDFGAVLCIGSGGTAVELFRDVAWLALPTSAPAVRDTLGRLKVATLLAGFRGAAAADTDALVEAAVRFGDRFLATTPAAAEIEINPLLVLPVGKGVVAVDAVIKS